MPLLPIDFSSLAALLVHSKVIPVALADRDRLVLANTAFLRLLGRAGEISGTPVVDLFVEAARARVSAALRACGQPESTCVAMAIRPDGSIVDVELRFDAMAPEDGGLVAIVAQDVTDRSRADAQLNLLTYSDPLTGQANRAMFADRLRQTALAVRRNATIFGLLMLDLDGFKAINDRYGRAAGDAVLQRIGGRLLASLRDTDTVARLGGDEFAVLLPDLKPRAAAAIVAHRLIEIVRQPIAIDNCEMAVGVSVGIAIFPEHANAVDELVAAADIARYSAKRQGRNRFAWASPASTATASPMPLTWGATQQLGVPEIDQQHAELASRLNEFGRAMRNGEDPERQLCEVIRYAAFHFATEERIMLACGYAGTEAHGEMHRQLLGELRELRVTGDGVNVRLVLRYLQEWLLRHVDGADRDLADALRARLAVPPTAEGPIGVLRS